MLMASPFMNPAIDNADNGLCFSANSTKNALFQQIDGVFGVPIVVDDITTNPDLRKDLPSIIYSLNSGEPKSRLNSNSEKMKGYKGWNGVVFTSSEMPILDFGEQQSGVKVRVLHTQGIQWTKSAQEAEHVKQIVSKNYGFTGKEFADFVATFSIDILSSMHEESLKIVNDFMKKRDGLSDRLANKFAAIHLTAKLLNQAFNYGLSADKLIERFIQSEQETFEERDNATKAYAAIIDYIYRNEARFLENKQVDDKMVDTYSEYRPNNIYGRIIKYKKYWEVRLVQDITLKILSEKGLDGEIRAIRKKWIERGITKGEGSHNTISCNINGQKVRCDCFIIQGGIVEPEIDPLQIEEKPINETPVSDYSVDDTQAIGEIFGGDYEDKR
jgi:hypothetical protein